MLCQNCYRFADSRVKIKFHVRFFFNHTSTGLGTSLVVTLVGDFQNLYAFDFGLYKRRTSVVEKSCE